MQNTNTVATSVGIDREAIADAYQLIRPHVRRTPVVEASGSEFGIDGNLVFKLELLQHAGSFKARGAFTNLLRRDVPPVGVVAATGGDHGVAVAVAGMKVGEPAPGFVSTVASPAKNGR